MSEEIIDKIIQNLSPEYRIFIESDFAETAAREFGNQIGFAGRQFEILENAILLYLLAIINDNEVVAFISNNCNLPTSEVSVLWTGIKTIIPGEVKGTLATTYKHQLTNNLSSDTLVNEIRKTELELNSLQTVRTMSHDMAAIKPGSDVVYQASSQADILDRSVEVREDVVSVAPQATRWDSENPR